MNLMLRSFLLAWFLTIGTSREVPLVDGHGREISNELQLIEPQNIRHAKDINSIAAATIFTVDPSPLIINNDDVVTVQYFSTVPSSGDWIGAYSPADVDVTTTVPVKYGYCDESSTYLTDGTGSLRFNMTNLRADIAFYYFSNGTKYPIAHNVSTSVTYFNFNQPLRARISATGDVDVLDLLWSSYNSSAPVLRWGTASGDYSQTVPAATTTITKDQMMATPASTIGWRDLGLIHRASFTGMAPLANTIIYYSFGDAATNDWSAEHLLHLPPLPGTQPPTRPTTVILFDDLGRGSLDDTYTWREYGRPAINTTMRVAAEIAEGKVDAVYHGGDISYATGYIAVWDFFLDMLEPMASSVVYLTTVGNHESDCVNSASYFNVNDSGGECGILATELMPMPAPATTNQPWWSYDVGLLHLVGMSTEHNFTIGSPQYLWLEADLAAVDRSVTPWVIFGGHRAMYINSNYGGAATSDIVVMEELIANIEPLLYKYEVNFAFWGHNHAVQRMTAVYDSKVVQESTIVEDESGNEIARHTDPQATIHYVIGTGGASFTVNYVTPYPAWNEKVFYQWGYSRVTAVNETFLDIQWVDSGDGQVYDHMVIIRNNPYEEWSGADTNSNHDDDKTGWFSLSKGVQGTIIGASVFLFCASIILAMQWYRTHAKRQDERLTEILPVHEQGRTRPTQNPLV